MAQIPDRIKTELQTTYPDVPLERAIEGARSAGNISSVEQLLRLAIGEVFDEKGGVDGPDEVRKMLPNDPELADQLIEERLGQKPTGY